MIKKLWRNISEIGLANETDPGLRRRVTLTNSFNFFGSLVYLLSVINDFYLRDNHAGLIDSILFFVCIVGFTLNKLRHFETAVALLFFNTLFATFYFDSYYGLASGNYLYYFPLMLGIAFIFDPRRDRKKILFYVLLCVAAIMTNVFTEHKLFANENTDALLQKHLFAFNIFFSSSVVGFFAYVVISRNIQQSKTYEQQILEQKTTEEALQQAVKEKEVLLAELHHRVKNNMAIISGLFSFTIDSTDNEETKRILNESKSRIYSMALIHNKLYQKPGLEKVRFDEYITDLVKEVEQSFPANRTDIEIALNLEPISLDINRAIPGGLILNELLINCYKHAFKNRDKGTILIILRSDKTKHYLLVIDDGVGIDEGYKEKESIGMMVLDALTEQLDATYTIASKNGTHFEMIMDIAKAQ